MKIALGGRTASLAVSAAAAVSLLAVAAPGHAAPADTAAAVQTNALAQALAVTKAASFNLSHPNITCATPHAKGAVVTTATKAAMVTVAGTDAYTGWGECVSATKESFTVYVTIEVQTYDPNSKAYVGTGCVRSGSGKAVNGVGSAIIAPALCELPAGTAGRMHQVKAYLTTDRFSDVYEGVSAPYQG